MNICSITEAGAQYTVREKNGTVRQMTQQEIDVFCYPLETSIDILHRLNNEESGETVCERCDQFHPLSKPAPVRTMYADGKDPQPFLCPPCTDEWNHIWDSMWADYRSGLL